MRPRIFEAIVQRSLREFPVTTVLGLRQVGKTTLVRRISGRAYVTLDDLAAYEAARRDPQGFLAELPRPVTIDEVQRVPELLLPIKREVDRRRRHGAFLLTGSARIDLRRGAQETLAGRAALLRLRPMTWSEAAARPNWNPVELLLGTRSGASLVSSFSGGMALKYERILAGGLPVPLLQLRGARRARWLEQYRAAYVERDLPPLVRVEEVSALVRFLSLCAARTSQTTNYAALAHDVGISADTGLRWSGALEATFLVDLVPPWFRNIGKRLVKAPKLHFADAGLAAHLAGISTWNQAVRQNFAGPLLETLVAQHLLAWADASKRPTTVHHYRTHAGAEVDFVLARDRRLVPIEVKATATPAPSDARGLLSFMSDFPESAFGVVLHGGADAVPLARRVIAIPLASFLEGVAC